MNVPVDILWRSSGEWSSWWAGWLWWVWQYSGPSSTTVIMMATSPTGSSSLFLYHEGHICFPCQAAEAVARVRCQFALGPVGLLDS